MFSYVLNNALKWQLYKLTDWWYQSRSQSQRSHNPERPLVKGTRALGTRLWYYRIQNCFAIVLLKYCVDVFLPIESRRYHLRENKFWVRSNSVNIRSHWSSTSGHFLVLTRWNIPHPYGTDESQMLYSELRGQTLSSARNSVSEHCFANIIVFRC